MRNRYIIVFLLTLAMIAIVATAIERPDPVRQKLNPIQKRMTRAVVELIMVAPTVVTEDWRDHDILSYHWDGAVAEIQISRETGWVVGNVVSATSSLGVGVGLAVAFRLTLPVRWLPWP